MIKGSTIYNDNIIISKTLDNISAIFVFSHGPTRDIEKYNHVKSVFHDF